MFYETDTDTQSHSPSHSDSDPSYPSQIIHTPTRTRTPTPTLLSKEFLIDLYFLPSLLSLLSFLSDPNRIFSLFDSIPNIYRTKHIYEIFFLSFCRFHYPPNYINRLRLYVNEYKNHIISHSHSLSSSSASSSSSILSSSSFDSIII
jgi:hypothetical protein